MVDRRNEVEFIFGAEDEGATDVYEALISLLNRLEESMDSLKQAVEEGNEELEDFEETAEGAGQASRASVNGFDQLAAVTVTLTGSLVAMGTAIGVQVLGKLKELAGALVEAGRASIFMGDQISKDSARLGVAVETLSGLQFAAGQSGVGYEGLTQALRQGAINLEAATRGTGEAIIALDALKISAIDAEDNMRGAYDVMLDLADVFSRAEDGSDKAAYAMRIFGESGAALVPLLNEGREGIEAMIAQAERLGVVLSERDAAQMVNVIDRLGELKAAWQGLAIEIAMTVLPGLLAVLYTAQDIVVEIKDGVGELTVFLGNLVIAIQEAFNPAVLWQFYKALGSLRGNWFIPEEAELFIAILQGGIIGTMGMLSKFAETYRAVVDSIAEMDQYRTDEDLEQLPRTQAVPTIVYLAEQSIKDLQETIRRFPIQAVDRLAVSIESRLGAALDALWDPNRKLQLADFGRFFVQVLTSMGAAVAGLLVKMALLRLAFSLFPGLALTEVGTAAVGATVGGLSPESITTPGGGGGYEVKSRATGVEPAGGGFGVRNTVVNVGLWFGSYAEQLRTVQELENRGLAGRTP